MYSHEKEDYVKKKIFFKPLRGLKKIFSFRLLFVHKI